MMECRIYYKDSGGAASNKIIYITNVIFQILSCVLSYTELASMWMNDPTKAMSYMQAVFWRLKFR